MRSIKCFRQNVLAPVLFIPTIFDSPNFHFKKKKLALLVESDFFVQFLTFFQRLGEVAE